MLIWKAGVVESSDIIRRTIDKLMMTVEHKDRRGSDARRACGSLYVTVERQLNENTIATALGNCFETIRLAGCSLADMENIRRQILLENPLSVLGTLITQSCVLYCLVNEALIISSMTFTSRQDVEQIQVTMRDAFSQSAEVAADQMDSRTYLEVTGLGGAVTFLLYDRARPLPQIVQFRFANPGPSLYYAYRLYADASRADEIREENKVIHPAFCRPSGRALSA